MAHRCGTPEHEQVSGAECAWPQTDVTYFEALAFPGLSRGQVAAAYDLAASQWNGVCGVRLRRVDDPSKANIVAGVGPIDGPYNVLALSDLPCGASAHAQLAQLFDDSEPWPAEGIALLVACMCHEIGHAIGLSHSPEGSGNLMDPILNPAVTRPQPGDVDQVVARYGKPAPPPAPPGSPAQLGAALGTRWRPFVLGPVADGLIAAAAALEHGKTAQEAGAAFGAIADGWRDEAYNRLAETLGVAALGPADRAVALRSAAAAIAAGMGASS